MDRERAMREAIHSGEMEGAWVSAEFRSDAEAYVVGEITREEFEERTKRRWAKRRDVAPCGERVF